MGRPLRIAHLTTIDMSLALLLGTELAEDVAAGHVVFGVSAPGRYVDRVEALGVDHVPIPSLTRAWKPSGDARAFGELIRTLRRLDLDVLHTHNPKTGVMGRVAGRLVGVPVIVNTCHGLWAGREDRLRKRIFVLGLEALAARFSDYELFQNADDSRTLRRFLKRGRHRVVGNGVDLQRFLPDPQAGRRFREAWGIPGDALVVGTVGRRVAEKGLSEFIATAAALADQATFVWVGPDDGQRVETDGTQVVFIPEQTDMPAVYSAFDVFVLASHREGFSRASMEAAACGLPMVLSDIRGCREIGEPGVHVLLASPRGSAAFTAAVASLLSDPDLRHRLAEAARARALDHFDQRQIARSSLEAYSAVAETKGLGWAPTTG